MACQEKQKEAEKRRAAAERNLDALKTQTKACALVPCHGCHRQLLGLLVGA